MSSEYGSEQRNSVVPMLKQRAQTPPTLTDQQPNILYTMPMQTVERLENVLRNTLALQENIRSSMTSLATKESLQDMATAEYTGASGEHTLVDVVAGYTERPGTFGDQRDDGGMAESDRGTEPGDVSVYAASPGGDAGGEPTGWEEARRVYEDTLRLGAEIPGGWRGDAEHLPPLDAADVHGFGGGVHGVHHPGADAAEITEKIVRLLSSLESGASDDVADSTTQHHCGDRKALAREREKKTAMGHKADDHEDGQKMV